MHSGMRKKNSVDFTVIKFNSCRAFVKLATFIKIRTFAKSDEELWLDEWANPLQGQVLVTTELKHDLQCPIRANNE